MKSEQFEQIYLMDWAFNYPDIYPFLIHIPNEGKRTPITGAIAKKMGLKKGVSDLFLAYPTKEYSGFWIELKAAKGKPTREQLSWIELMESVGFKAGVYYGWIEAAKAINIYLGKVTKGL